MISNQETELEFTDFFNGLIKLAEDLGFEMDPEYIMMDAFDASYNAATEVFPQAKVLMCYFHLMKNVRKNCEKPLDPVKYEDLLEDIRIPHMTKSAKEYESNLSFFKEKWDKKKTKVVYDYMVKWFNGRIFKMANIS